MELSKLNSTLKFLVNVFDVYSLSKLGQVY